MTAASRPGGRSPGGVADAAGRRKETAVDNIRQVESDATVWLLGLWLVASLGDARLGAQCAVEENNSRARKEDVAIFRNPKAADGRTRAI